MNKNVGIAAAVGIVIVITAITFQIYEPFNERSTIEEYYEDKSHNDDTNIKSVVYPENQQVLYGLIITKDKYLLGENVFVVLKDIRTTDKGEVLFITPGGTIFEKLTFDGEVKTTYKKYFRPQLLRALDLCEKDNLVGEWTVMFRGVEQSVLHFEIVDAILPNQEYQYVECGIAYEIDIIP